MHTGRRFKRPAAVVAALASAALIATGCGGSDESGSSSSSGSSDQQAQSDSSEDAETSQATEGASNISSPGVDLRVTMDRLLAEHAAVGLAALHKTMSGQKDAEAAVGALQENTNDLSEAIGSVYGDDAAEAFKSQWEAHIGMFVEYATGVAKKDDKLKAKATKDLAGYEKSFAKFLNDATGLPADAGAAALGAHVDQLMKSMDQYGAGDYEASMKTAREAYNHMFATGDALSGAISEQKPEDFGTGDVSKAAADTRVLVDKQLGEHAFLAGMATMKSLMGTKDAEATVAALDANTDDLGETIGSVYGKDAQEAFESQWRAHIGMFVDYTVGTAKNDDEMKQKAAEDLEGYSENFSKFLADATGGDQEAFKAGLEEHVAQLAGAIDATDDGDYEKAWELQREAYAHMFMTGDALVSAIVAQNPDKFPAGEGGAEGETASESGSHSDSMGG